MQSFPSAWYVVTGDDARHLIMAMISATTLKRVIPEISICLAQDAIVNEVAQKTGLNPHAYFDHVRQFESRFSSAFLRCRDIKIRLRKEITGNFIFFDTDTLVVDRFDEITSTVSDVGMTHDMEGGIPGALPGSLRHFYKTLDWDYPPGEFFNSGVIFWRDTLPARQLSDRWIANWTYSCTREVLFDQPALAQSNEQLNKVITVLPVTINISPLVANLELTRKARVWHFWPYAKHKGTVLHALVDQFRQSGKIDMNLFEKARKRRCPWVRQGNMGVRHLAKQRCWNYALLELPAALLRLARRISK